jgi:hypothetical protein
MGQVSTILFYYYNSYLSHAFYTRGFNIQAYFGSKSCPSPYGWGGGGRGPSPPWIGHIPHLGVPHAWVPSMFGCHQCLGVVHAWVPSMYGCHQFLGVVHAWVAHRPWCLSSLMYGPPVCIPYEVNIKPTIHPRWHRYALV